ncbi:MAG: hypothetical protein Q7U66_07765 [Methylobacter sp.]|nr:hypothetical protein [Methylobacter sp.]
MKQIMIFMTLLFMATNYAQADEGDARLANAIKKYQAEKENRTTNSNKKNQTEKDNSSDSDVKSIERSMITDPTNADPEPQGESNLPPS